MVRFLNTRLICDKPRIGAHPALLRTSLRSASELFLTLFMSLLLDVLEFRSVVKKLTCCIQTEARDVYLLLCISSCTGQIFKIDRNEHLGSLFAILNSERGCFEALVEHRFGKEC